MTPPRTIASAAAALRSGEATSVDLTGEALERIGALDARLGAFIAVNEAGAMQQAAQADADFAAGIDRGPLQGIPFGIKDILATRDQPTTANSLILDPAWGEGRDAVVTERLRAAGAVIMGKLVLSEFALGRPDEDKPFPIPRNPWRLDRTPGGSSSGTGHRRVHRHGARRPRDRHRRLRALPGGVLRGHGAQGHVRSRPEVGLRPARLQPRLDRPDGPLVVRLRRHPQRHRRPRPA